MSFNHGGFTEDDQARIAEEVQGRVGGRRAGLGFGGSSSSPKCDLASSTGSSWFRPTPTDYNTFESVKNDHDTTKGVFPWDGGHRGKAGGGAKRNAAAAIPPPGEAPSEGGRTRERDFPMIRDRDIKRNKDGRDRKRSVSTSPGKHRRSGSSGREREKSGWRNRSRSRSRDRGRNSRRETRHEANNQYEHENRRDRAIDRGWNRARYRDKDKEARRSERRSPSPVRVVRDVRDRSDDRKTSNGDTSSSVPTVEKTKKAMKRRLQQVASADVSLKVGFPATLGGGAGWERAEMSTASDFFKNDEVAAKGGVASVAPEYEARLAEILAVEDEDSICLGDGIRKNAASASADGLIKDVDPRTKAHHDAIFSPRRSEVSQSLPTTLAVLPSESPSTKGVRMTSSTKGGIGAAARARLALKGKIGEASKDLVKSVQSKGNKSSKGMMDDSPPPKCQDADDKPLFKTLRVGDSVEARYTADDEWYKSVVLQVIHGGFEIARFKVRYTDYGNEETLSWKRIRRMCSPDVTTTNADGAMASPTIPTPTPPTVTQQAKIKGKPTESDNISHQSFAGMCPRSIRSEKERKKVPEQQDMTPEQPGDVNVVNSTILSTVPGRKLSWREKLKTRKVAANEAHESSTDANPPQPQKISLVPDFAAQKREREAGNMLNKNNWRVKVAFGLGDMKKKTNGE